MAVGLYHQGKKQEGIELGIKALKIDNSYGDLEFLKENLWGDKLLTDTTKFFENSAIAPLVGKKPKSEIPLE